MTLAGGFSCQWIMVFQRDLVRAAEHFLRVARYVFPSPIGDPCELPRSPFLANQEKLIVGRHMRVYRYFQKAGFTPIVAGR